MPQVWKMYIDDNVNFVLLHAQIYFQFNIGLLVESAERR